MCPYDGMERLELLVSFCFIWLETLRFVSFLVVFSGLSYQKGVTNVMLFWNYQFNVLYTSAG